MEIVGIALATIGVIALVVVAIGFIVYLVALAEGFKH